MKTLKKLIISSPGLGIFANKDPNLHIRWNLSKEIKLYEPKIALRGGKDGLSCFREIAYKIQKITHFKSLCFIEIGYNQKNKCIKIFEEFGIHCVDIIVDYQNYDRILVLKKK